MLHKISMGRIVEVNLILSGSNGSYVCAMASPAGKNADVQKL